MGLEKLVGAVKSKLARSVKMVRIRKINRRGGGRGNGDLERHGDGDDDMRWNYDKIEKSESTRIEMRSRKARKLIEETLRVADSPSRRSVGI